MSSYEDPIEAIYRMMKADRLRRRIGMVIKIVVVVGLFYGYRYVNLPENAALKASLIDKGQTKFEEFILPIVEKSVSSLTKKLQADLTKSTGKPDQGLSNISPEAIQAFCKSLPAR